MFETIQKEQYNLILGYGQKENLTVFPKEITNNLINKIDITELITNQFRSDFQKQNH